MSMILWIEIYSCNFAVVVSLVDDEAFFEVKIYDIHVAFVRITAAGTNKCDTVVKIETTKILALVADPYIWWGFMLPPYLPHPHPFGES